MVGGCRVVGGVVVVVGGVCGVEVLWVGGVERLLVLAPGVGGVWWRGQHRGVVDTPTYRIGPAQICQLGGLASAHWAESCWWEGGGGVVVATRTVVCHHHHLVCFCIYLVARN